MRLLRAVVIGAILGGAGAGWLSAADPPQAKSADVDVCALLPKEEASKILGRAITRTQGQKRSDGPMECRYTSAAPGAITIMVGGGVPRDKWEAFMKQLATSGARLEAVAGIGDAAYFWDAHRLYVHAGSNQIAITSSPTPDAVPAKTRAEVSGLGKAIVARLKG